MAFVDAGAARVDIEVLMKYADVFFSLYIHSMIQDRHKSLLPSAQLI